MYVCILCICICICTCTCTCIWIWIWIWIEYVHAYVNVYVYVVETRAIFICVRTIDMCGHTCILYIYKHVRCISSDPNTFRECLSTPRTNPKYSLRKCWELESTCLSVCIHIYIYTHIYTYPLYIYIYKYI